MTSAISCRGWGGVRSLGEATTGDSGLLLGVAEDLRLHALGGEAIAELHDETVTFDPVEAEMSG